MKQKKTHSALIVSILIFSVALVTCPIVTADIDAYTIKGILYLDDGEDTVPAGAGIQIDLEFNDGTETTTTFVQGSQGGINNYYFGFYDSHDEPEDQPGNFIIRYQGHQLIPVDNPTITIVKGQIWYYVNFTVDISAIDQFPSKVTGLTVTDAKDGKLDISWSVATDDFGIDHYNIYRDSAFLTTKTGTTYQDTGLTNGQSYTYQVSAVDTSAQEGLKSDLVSGTPTATTTGGGGGGGGGTGGGGGGGVVYTAPIADANGPYYAFLVDGIAKVTFDGTGSSGSITSYSWDFGDGETGTGVSPTHEYTALGNFTVNLTVTGPGGSNKDQTFAIISMGANNPPTAPAVSGLQTGSKNTDYDYTAVSTDADNDTLKYIFDWNDGTTTTTDFFDNGTAVTESHNWSAAGVYTVKVKASDNATESGTTSYVVLIDALWVKTIGYLLDTNGDGTYDSFYSNATGQETDVEKQTNGTYLIDSDGDADWNWIYDPTPDTLISYAAGSSGEAKADNTLWYALAIGTILAIILIAIIYLATRKKQKPKKK